MKRIPFTLLFLCLATSLFAQQQPKVYTPPKYVRDTSSFWIFKDLTLGPIFTAGIARQNGDIPAPWESNQTFAYMFGGTVDGSINKWIGLNLSILYDSRDLAFASPTNDTTIDLNIDYVAIQPSIRIAWLLIGLAFDIPMSGAANESVKYLPKTNGPYAGNLNANTKDLAMLTEVRANISIPILQVESGILHFIFSANYPLSKTLIGSSSFDTTGPAIHPYLGPYPGPPLIFTNLGGGKLPTVQAGLSYQFDILH